MAETRKKLAAETWGALLQVHAALVPELDRRLRDATGLPLTWYDVLLELSAARDGRLTMSQLGERAVLSRSRVSRVVDDLAAAGLVRRDTHPEDGRSAFAVITEAGLARFREAAPVYVSGIEQSLASLTVPDLQRLHASLRRVLDDHDGALPR
ncbi:MAG TPA: MarR family transcriptional regulator [Nocardioides sp.]|jgi:DNA-binding MarR family transcriptional regulator|nr:MarR family transcriptional regulator [Nocardioides sp.]